MTPKRMFESVVSLWRNAWLGLQELAAGESATRYGFHIARPQSYPTSPPRMRVRPHPGYIGNDASLEHHKNHWLAPKYHADLREAYRSLLGQDYTGSVLEVGCGMGHLHQVLGIPRERYWGVELNERFVQAGREAFPGIQLLQGTADRLPFPDNHFDCVLCSDVLIHLQDMRPALGEIIRVSRSKVLLRLRSGNGAFQSKKIVYDPVRKRLFGRVQLEGKWYYGYYNVLAPEDLKALLGQAGVTDYQCLDLLPPEAPTHGLTKVFFDVAQCRRKAAA